MKLEIERERFFVQYWNQKVMYVGGVGLVKIGKGGWNLSHPDFKLELRSIDSLTDEEYGCIAELTGYFDPKPYVGKNAIDEMFGFDKGYTPLEECVLAETGLKIYDYLRSIGILVPFAQYSVEQILSLGWSVVKK